MPITLSAAELKRETEQLGKLYGVAPQHSKGQNFLIQPKVYQTIVKAAELQSTDEVLEIGPGWGFLTMSLAEQAKKVVSVELDHRLAEILPSRLAIAGHQNIEIVNEDILKTVINRPDLKDSQKLTNIELKTGYKIVANLPYNITSICLKRFLAGEVERPSLIVVLVQDEVAHRLTAKPGELSLLGLMAQYYSNPEYIAAVPANDFLPKPKVNSAIVRFHLVKP
ncbi:MAG TPA: 16S rRNA (adenine(1518)-N(6)/adenine(1519)-N(6))-dimethyltransferase RsmA, partial [bacterium]|nr:16S rRNA (adenine(1518)-N(6)/adenine(1519)-N(6))-dimethyltransferase RsmA [bacterium]